jgi:2'-5' RNA ligase
MINKKKVIKIRTFIAIDFNKETKSYFEYINKKLEIYCIKGRFTNIDNFHLTLHFIGELEQNNIRNLLTTLEKSITKHDGFSLQLDALGSFKNGNSNLLWIGIKDSKSLVEVYKKLTLALKDQNISFDEKPLKPHITLGRQIILTKELSELKDSLTIDNLVIPVNNITLMESNHVNGKLTYTPIAIFPLKH